MAEMMTRLYSNLAGCDFSSDEAKVALNRSPNCINMYKDYSDTEGNCVQTRPGFLDIVPPNLHKRVTLENKLKYPTYGIYLFKYGNTDKLLVHIDNCIFVDNYPSSNLFDEFNIYNKMNKHISSFVTFNDKVYINDGKNYLVYDGEVIKDVAENAFIPTTTISRLPSGGGVLYQAVNVLTPRRKNSFVADGTSTEYHLDTDFIDNADVKVYIDGTEIATTDYSVNYVSGYITFNTAPGAPLTEGQDNVVVEFSKAGTDYSSRIPQCTRSIVFDNRIFFTGNPQFKNAIFHCELNDPTYISDLAYYQDGTSDTAIKDFCVGNNLLWVFKESSQQNDTIFYHEPTIDTEYGKIYPSKQGNISTGCVSRCTNFNDDIIFASKLGIEGINADIEKEQLIAHRSSLIDSKFVNENEYKNMLMTEWNGYLVCLVNSRLYLADSRQVFNGISGYEYEWYYWNFKDDFIDYYGRITCVTSIENELYIGTEYGIIFKLDKGRIQDGYTFDTSYYFGKKFNIYSCWQTPNDIFGDTNNLKTTNKRGGVAKIKTIPNGKIKVSVKTNRKEEKFIKEYSATGFDFSIVDFENFAFTTKEMSYIVFKIKMKKFIELTLKFYSDKEPFGLYDATLEVYKGSYIKRT